MKYVSIDIETTGLDRKHDQVLQIAVVVEDTEISLVEVEDLPHWECLIHHERIEGHPFALHMNAEIIGALRTHSPGSLDSVQLRGRSIRVLPNLVIARSTATRFLHKQYGTCPTAKGQYVAAGKNAAGFDLPFLGSDFHEHFHHRVIDVGNVALGSDPQYWRGGSPPGLADLQDSEVAHDALEDARDVVRILRKLTGRYGK